MKLTYTLGKNAKNTPIKDKIIEVRGGVVS